MNSQWTEQEFQNPPARFRGAPFWAWNNRLEKEKLKKQIGYFKEMGMGGFHIHCRTGLDTEYLGKEFLECVAECAEEGRKQGLYTYLYDEDRWPSGAAGGKVTKEEAYRSRFFAFVPDGEAEVCPEGKLLGSYRITLKDGYLESYRFAEKGEQGDGIWRLYLQTAKPSPWFNNQTYLDTLNKKAVERFLEVTHETYYTLLGEEFGKTIPSIFTDEPQFQRKETLAFAEEKKTLILPGTDSFEAFYRERYGESFLEHFPEVVWELPDGQVSAARYQYHDGIAELFATSFADTIGSWCREHHLMLTGHMMEEPTLLSQTSALGEAMRSYRGFQQPGIDMLCDWREYTTAKQAQSAAHQYGCPGVLSELYGVTNWDFDFRGHKLQGDWQAALGVTRRVHHLAWASMEGEAKRDYPAPIFYQSAWYQAYKMVEDHFARVNTALMRGKPRVRIGVIHPVESYWLHFGPREQTAQIREILEKNFRDVTEWLLFGNLDFDFLAESLLPGQNVHEEDGKLCVGDMRYDVILVPGCETLRSTTIAYLSAYAGHGGNVLFAGQLPEYVDARPNPEGKRLAERCTVIPFGQAAILEALEAYRELEIRKADGGRADQFLFQMREDGENRWLFLANVRKPENPDLPRQEPYQIRIRGSWEAELCDTQDGTVRKLAVNRRNGWTIFWHILDIHDSLLLRLTPAALDAVREQEPVSLQRPAPSIRKTIPQPDRYVLEEPNVLLLDQCEYRLDEEPWQETEEILRIDNQLRERFGYPKRMEAMPQPWVENEEGDTAHTIELRFRIFSEITCEGAELVLENAEDAEIFFRDVPVKAAPCGWFVDESLKRIRLGTVYPGENILRIRRPFGRKTNLEWHYLCGNFGVRVAGRSAYLTSLPEKLNFGDFTVQGLPFYAGNLCYETAFPVEREGTYQLQASKFRAPLLQVSVDGGAWKPIAYAPYQAELGVLKPGVHQLKLRVFGSRVNAFGAVHNCDETLEWFGPDAWRTQDEAYSYEYQIKPAGILKTPVLLEKAGQDFGNMAE
ncbi:MAG: hypothetical protein Q4F41_03250 [Eubacteriales bacterium]|nr:hypothetical protein [Eubacteriales bacterium]